MGNTSNREQWAVRERQLFIERLAWWKGFVNRGDLRDVFGISAAQASADLQAYQELNAGALSYNVKAKRYEAGAGMVCMMHEPRLEDAVRIFLGRGVPLSAVVGVAGDKVDIVSPVQRVAGVVVERRVFLAMDGGMKLRMKYWSMSSNRGGWREIAPHALGHDGMRWHVRAWCFENGDFRDFVLSRMEDAEWPGELFAPPRADEGWERMDEVVLTPHRGLKEEQRRGIERDYGMKNGVLRLKVREAMKEYVLAHHRVQVVGRPVHLEVREGS